MSEEHDLDFEDEIRIAYSDEQGFHKLTNSYPEYKKSVADMQKAAQKLERQVSSQSHIADEYQAIKNELQQKVRLHGYDWRSEKDLAEAAISHLENISTEVAQIPIVADDEFDSMLREICERVHKIIEYVEMGQTEKSQHSEPQ